MAFQMVVKKDCLMVAETAVHLVASWDIQKAVLSAVVMVDKRALK
jgi:hypothetical protein